MAGLVSAQQVESENIVGYQSQSTLSGKMDIVGVQFEGVGGTNISIQAIVPVSGFSTTGGDLIKIWNPLTRTYVSAYYYDTLYSADYNTTYGAGWGDIDQIKLDLTIDPGQGFWITTAQNATFMIAGQIVDKTANQVSTLSGKMDLVCNTFPVSMSIQDVVPVSGFSTTGGDLIKIWNASTRTYVSAYYYDTLYSADYNTTYGAGWGDIDQIKLDTAIGAGQGFWLTTAQNAVASFTVPAGL
jgi:effector-binding domain-containing protein